VAAAKQQKIKEKADSKSSAGGGFGGVNYTGRAFWKQLLRPGC